MKHALSILVILLLTAGAHAYPMNASDTEIANSLDYFKSQQDSDGCIGGFSTSAWVISAVTAAGEDPSSSEWSTGDNSLVDCIKKDALWFDDPGRTATDFERQIIAIVAADKDPKNFNGLDYVAKLKSMYNHGEAQMGSSTLLNDDFWGVIALICAGEPASSTEIQGMVNFIESNQGTDNGWSWGTGQSSDADSTATAIMALVSAGKPKTETNIENAIDYLKTQQHSSSAGFVSWGQANPDSTSYAIESIAAVEQDPTSAEWDKNGTNPVDYILDWQQADGGFSNPYANPELTSSGWTTANAVNALLGKPHPVKTIQQATSHTMAIRIEAPDQTILDTEIELPDSIDFTSSNSQTTYTLTEPSLLMGLLQAGKENSFSVSISDEWYPAMGFYVNGVAGYDASGLDGWNIRVDYHSTGFTSVNSFIWQESSPPNPPHEKAVWFYGDWNASALRITAGSTEANAGENVDVTVEYFHKDEGKWHPLEGATVKGASSEQTTDDLGTATITFSSGGAKQVYAEKPDGKYFRSEKLEFSVDGGEQTSSDVRMTSVIIPAVSFSVNPLSIDFGSFGPGYNVSGTKLTLKNSGSWNLKIEAEVTDSEGTLYTKNLLLDANPWDIFLMGLTADPGDFVHESTVSTSLDTPENYSGTGTETGTLTFWATATGIPD